MLGNFLYYFALDIYHGIHAILKSSVAGCIQECHAYVTTSSNQAKGNARLKMHVHLLVSLIFATQRATCKAIKPAADFFEIRQMLYLHDHKGITVLQKLLI